MAKFCTKCGRKLEEGEVCTCTSAIREASQQIYTQQPQTEEYGSLTGGTDGQQHKQYYNQGQQQGQYYDQKQQNQYKNQGQNNQQSTNQTKSHNNI